ncbi:hypothetical protein HDU87_000878 [Geranomyces variabilis]|uniref:Trichohyalin-plectin-homology domain-containing protein n=1 Tax=Geranomyces variabilis TaxID=109894 RepID=A0AAD5TE56_9FUNG|nr:hypothetical protein HDU87_000878 [Geranomyces variabilis]
MLSQICPPDGPSPSAPAQNAFIPYTAKPDRDPRGAPVETAAAAGVETRVRLQEVESAKALAKTDKPELLLRSAMLKEREELHQKSMNRARGWGNTIMGGRRQRLAARDERQQKQEDERQRVDKEWAALKASEREAAINRAKDMLRDQEPRVKKLHSALVLSNVLQERDAQVLQRRSERTARKAYDAAEAATYRSAAQHAIVAEAEARMRARMVAISRRNEQQAQARTRAAELAGLAKGEVLFDKPGGGNAGGGTATGGGVLTEKKAEIDFAALDAQAAAEAIKAWEEKIEQGKAQRIALDEAIALRRLETQKAREADTRANAENLKFGEMKALFEAQRKEAETRTVRRRQRASEIAGKVAASEAFKKHEAQDAFSECLLHAHDGVWEHRVETERQKRSEALKEAEAFRIAHAAEVRERLKLEKAEAETVRLANMVEDAADVDEDLATEKARKALVDNLKLQHRQEILDHKANARAAAEVRLASEVAALASADAEDAEFDAYALERIDEWRKLGRDIIPLLHVLQQERDARRHALLIEDLATRTAKTNTFARLGFGYS